MASRNPPNRLLAVFPGGSGGATVRDGATSVDVAARVHRGSGRNPLEAILVDRATGAGPL